MTVVREAIAPWAASSAYLNFAEPQRDPATFWTAEADERLRHIQAAVDPCDGIRSNHPIPSLRTGNGSGGSAAVVDPPRDGCVSRRAMAVA